jgi:two-component system cell cycle sensor histidine kinase/response regulator CckA
MGTRDEKLDDSTVYPCLCDTVDESVPRILVVDDDETARSYTQKVLERNGYSVVTAESALKVLQVLEHDDAFDLFVLDVAMPKMTGPELAPFIRRACPNAKLLYVTGDPDRLFTDRNVPWEAFIVKPMSAESLLRTVRLLLSGTFTTPSAR